VFDDKYFIILVLLTFDIVAPTFADAIRR